MRDVRGGSPAHHGEPRRPAQNQRGQCAAAAARQARTGRQRRPGASARSTKPGPCPEATAQPTMSSGATQRASSMAARLNRVVGGAHDLRSHLRVLQREIFDAGVSGEEYCQQAPSAQRTAAASAGMPKSQRHASSRAISPGRRQHCACIWTSDCVPRTMIHLSGWAVM